jgi:hypothetical protein
MIIKGIEVTKFKWNDKEVSEEEYQRLDEEWKKSVEEAESSQEPPKKNSRKSKNG